LLGPPGLAFMFVRKDLISTLAPTVTGWFAQSNPFAFDPRHIDLSPTARRFESGSPSVPNVYAAMPGFELLQEIGMENVATHIRKLTQALLRAAVDFGIRAKTPSDSTGPLVVLQSSDANLLVQKLAESDIVASSRLDGLRIAFHVYNTLDDVNAVLEVLRKNINLLVRETAGVRSDD
jgi:selenocysteine lyase/cysteine desulfurase